MNATPQRRQAGRPKSSDATHVPARESRIFRFLAANMPKRYWAYGRFSVELFAVAVDVSPKTIYRWIAVDKIVPEAAEKVVAASDGKITMHDMVEFFLPATR